MARYLKVFRDFSGGLSEVANDNMRDTELVEARNVVPGDDFCIARASGVEIAYPQIPGGKPVALLIELKPTTGDTQVLAFTQASASTMDMYIYDAVRDEWDAVSSGIASVLDWFIYGGSLYWLDGTEYKVYNGSTVDNVANAFSASSGFWDKIRAARAVEQRGQRWFFATTGNEIIFTEVGYVNKFIETHIINITAIGSDGITALHEFNEGLLIFQKRSVSFLSGWDLAGGADVKLARLNVTAGTKWPKSVRTVDNGVIYLAPGGLYLLRLTYATANVAAVDISAQKVSRRLVDNGQISDAYGIVWNGVYHLSIRRDADVKEYRYYQSKKSFFGEYTHGALCYAAGLLGDNTLYIGCSNGYVLKFVDDVYHYINLENGGYTGIPVLAKTKGFDVVGSMVQDAKLKKAYVAVKQYAKESTALSVQIKADYADAAWNWEVDFDESLVYGEGVWGEAYWGWKDVVTKEIAINRQAKRLQFTFYDDTMDDPLLVYGLATMYRRKKVKGSRDGVSKAAITYED